MVTKLLFLSFVIIAINKVCAESFWQKRHQLEDEEAELQIGHDIILNDAEKKVDDVLMNAKYKEINQGYKNSRDFLPGHHFFNTKPLVEKSEVFQLIKNIPKGGVLHCHANSCVSQEFIYNLTYEEHLYLCTGNNSEKLFNYSKTPPTINHFECELLAKLRDESENLTQFNEEFKKSLTLIVPNPREVYPYREIIWDRFDSLLGFIESLIFYRPVFEKFLYQTLLELHDDGVFYTELRTSADNLYELNGTQHDHIQTFGIWKQVIDRFKNDHPNFFDAHLIITSSRFLQSIKEDIDIFLEIQAVYPELIVGFDIPGDEETGYPNSKYVDQLEPLVNKTKFFFHAGETKWYGLPADMNILDVIVLNTTRIGHGYALLKHPSAMKFVKQHNVGVEVSPISNQVLMMVDDLRNHPAAVWFGRDMPIVISNDNPGVWGSSGLTYDWYMAFMAFTSKETNIRFLKQLALNSIKHSAMNETEKERANEKYNQLWNKYITEMSNHSF